SPPKTQYTNRVCLDSDQTSPTCDQRMVKLPLDITPTGLFHKSGIGAVPYGGIADFELSAANKSVVKLNDLVFLDKVPTNTTFRSAWFEDPKVTASGAKIFYSTAVIVPESWDNPPPADYTKAPAGLDF